MPARHAALSVVPNKSEASGLKLTHEGHQPLLWGLRLPVRRVHRQLDERYLRPALATHQATDALRQEVSQFGVDAVVIEPGVVATDFYDRVLSDRRHQPHGGRRRSLSRAGHRRHDREGGPGIDSPDRVADVILRAATADRPNPAYRVGPLATLSTAVSSAVRGRVRDRASRAGVRTVSSDLVQRFLNQGSPS